MNSDTRTDPPVSLLAGNLFADLTKTAETSPRRRTNHNFHDGPEEVCHRFLNVMMRDTYITPHRHVTPLKAESFILLEGRGAFFIFDDEGEILRCDLLDADAPRAAVEDPAQAARRGAVGIDVRPGVWHAMIVLSPRAVCFEVKPGPYDAATDKEFAAWAPREEDESAPEYREKLRKHAEDLFGA